MNQPNPENTPIGEVSLPAFKNRSTGLTVFGILTIVLGCLAGLMVLVMLAGMVMAANLPKAQAQPVSGTATIILIYGGLAAGLIWLGIGSIMARRWARALILIFSWAWLVTGISMVFFMGFFLPKVWANLPPVNGQPAMPPSAMTVMTIFMMLFFSIFFVALPAIWIFFYGSRHVKATVEMRDPAPSWTDACPLPVLGLSLWLLFSALMLLLLSVMYHGVMPFFGMLLEGVTGSLLYVAIAALWAYCAWRIYKMDVRGWWLILVAMTLYMVSSVMTFARHDMAEMYHAMGYPQAQIDQIQNMGIFAGNSMVWMMVIFFVPFLGFIVYVKKYLPGKA